MRLDIDKLLFIVFPHISGGWLNFAHRFELKFVSSASLAKSVSIWSRPFAEEGWIGINGRRKLTSNLRRRL